MELMLQYGYGMLSLSEELIQDWGGGTVIMSPRDMSISQMETLSNSIINIGGKVLIDPQFYLPRSEHERLNSHSYWPTQYNTGLFDSNAIRTFINALNVDYNSNLNSSIFIAPGIYSSEIDLTWFDYHNQLIQITLDVVDDKPIYATVCLSSDIVMSEYQVHTLLEYLESFNVSGIYLIPEPHQNRYLVDNPIWLLNLLDLCAGVKLQGKKVIVGYSNQQMLILANAKVDAIASGNWMNVRSFGTDRFEAINENMSRRSTWYYSPQVLSEYQIPMLDIGFRLGILDQLKTNSNTYGSNHSDILFEGAQPTSTNYGERDSFKHFLKCLKFQAESAVKDTYDNTKKSTLMRLETASMLIEFLSANGVNGRNRDFGMIADNQRSITNAFHGIRGMSLSHLWPEL